MKTVKLSTRIKKEIQTVMENEIDHLEDDLNFALGEIIDNLHDKELQNVEKRLEALVFAREIFFKG